MYVIYLSFISLNIILYTWKYIIHLFNDQMYQ